MLDSVSHVRPPEHSTARFNLQNTIKARLSTWIFLWESLYFKTTLFFFFLI